MNSGYKPRSAKKKIAEKISFFITKCRNIIKRNKSKPVNDIVETLPELASPSLSSLSSSSSSSSSPSSPSSPSILWSSSILSNNPEPAQYSPSYPLYQYPQYSQYSPLLPPSSQLLSTLSLPCILSTSWQVDRNDRHRSYQTYQEMKPWDEREMDDELYPQSQKLSLGWCMECRKLFTGKKWCRSCNAAHFHEQTSEWTTKGGYSIVYKAIWKQGPIIYWDTNINNWERFGSHEVVLKVIKGSQKNLGEFINELSAHHKFNTMIGHVLRCFGISRWKDTGDFIVVTSKGKQLIVTYNSFQNAEIERKYSNIGIEEGYTSTIDQISQLISIKWSTETSIRFTCRNKVNEAEKLQPFVLKIVIFVVTVNMVMIFQSVVIGVTFVIIVNNEHSCNLIN
ncbi:unnamed protein product [Rhizophagus irregularis]|nr:unnamed protein product [Rhizophagus irregularis]